MKDSDEGMLDDDDKRSIGGGLRIQEKIRMTLSLIGFLNVEYKH
jgi:hypothetical protein